ncbi:MAG: rRNA pseudouridine synthase [Desulfobulbaceae bacterium]|nr:rRNA pseudouridine synthase [Desulfobulbaceae bacterium]
MEERLQKILARAGIGSRRKCEEFIKQGRVTVDGKPITGMGTKVDAAKARITFDGKPISSQEPVYLLLNKPTGYVTTLSDPQGRPIITDLLPEITARVFPVGRLDLNSEGALLITNDGRMTNFILHPRYGVNKTYEITVNTAPDSERIHRLERGIILDGTRTLPAEIRFLSRKKGNVRLQVILHEGKKRQVRKMFSAIGHPVKTLKRTAYGRLTLGRLRPAEYRFLTGKDIKKVFSGKIPFTIKNIPD